MTPSTEELIQRAANDILQSEYIVALTGAGFSTESGIPDFRGPDGIWTQNPELELKAYEDYDRFRADPKQWWIEQLSLSVDIITEWGKARPNPGHAALVELEKIGKLKRVLTQNVDNLHQKAGSNNVIDYHGNIDKLRCLGCNSRYPLVLEDLRQMKANDRLPPRCKACGDPLKPDVVYFGEPIPRDAAAESEAEALRCDMMLIGGTSAVVYPFAGLPILASGKRRSALDEFLSFGQNPQRRTIIVEINAEPTPLTEGGISDYLIEGKTGEILPRIVSRVMTGLSM
jgi:NAD-dependent deacetylase